MTMAVDPHTQCRERLPTLVVGGLSPQETSALLAHTRECVDCRTELEFAQRLHTHFGEEWRTVAPLLADAHEQLEFARLWTRIGAGAPNAASRYARASRLGALAAGLAAIFVGTAWYLNASAPQYRTLADSPISRCVALRVRLDAPNADAVALLESSGARVVAGPTGDGIYTLQSPRPADLLQRLRTLPGVRIVAPTNC